VHFDRLKITLSVSVSQYHNHNVGDYTFTKSPRSHYQFCINPTIVPGDNGKLEHQKIYLYICTGFISTWLWSLQDVVYTERRFLLYVNITNFELSSSTLFVSVMDEIYVKKSLLSILCRIWNGEVLRRNRDK